MKTIKVLASFLVLFLAVQTGYSQCSKDNPFKTTKFTVDAKSDHCKMVIEDALKATNGVESATFDLASQVATVKYNSTKTNATDLQKVVTDKGYTVTPIKTSYHPCSHSCGGSSTGSCH